MILGWLQSFSHHFCQLISSISYLTHWQVDKLGLGIWVIECLIMMYPFLKRSIIDLLILVTLVAFAFGWRYPSILSNICSILLDCFVHNGCYFAHALANSSSKGWLRIVFILIVRYYRRNNITVLYSIEIREKQIIEAFNILFVKDASAISFFSWANHQHLSRRTHKCSYRCRNENYPIISLLLHIFYSCHAFY